MLKIINNEITGSSIKPFIYAKPKGLLGKAVLPLTRWLRVTNALKYMRPAQRHLDIGCGDGYFLKRSTCEERFGLDKLLGDEITDKIDFANTYFDYVTMLAVIEHISDPGPLLKEITRVLKPGGKLIITTPIRFADKVINIYAKEIEEEHVRWYDLSAITDLAGKDYMIRGYHRFLFGLNQVFFLKKLA